MIYWTYVDLDGDEVSTSSSSTSSSSSDGSPTADAKPGESIVDDDDAPPLAAGDADVVLLGVGQHFAGSLAEARKKGTITILS